MRDGLNWDWTKGHIEFMSQNHKESKQGEGNYSLPIAGRLLPRDLGLSGWIIGD